MTKRLELPKHELAMKTTQLSRLSKQLDSSEGFKNPLNAASDVTTYMMRELLDE